MYEPFQKMHFCHKCDHFRGINNTSMDESEQLQQNFCAFRRQTIGVEEKQTVNLLSVYDVRRACVYSIGSIEITCFVCLIWKISE